jgi:hypothetical protein
MRRTLLAFAAGVLLLGASGAAQAAALYPDLETLPPRNLRFDYTDVSVDGSGVLHHVLRFSNTAVNVGEGPVEIRATIDPSRNPPSGPAYQRVYDSGGGFSDLPLGGSLYYHAVHKHYHFDDWGGYQLWTKAAYDRWVATGSGSPDLVGTKTTSCVTDEELVASIAPAVFPGQYPASACMPDAQHVIGEGLSPGWGDTYDYYRFEQWIDLGANGSLSDGTYVLRSIADPDNIVYESPGKASGAREGAADNAAVTTFGVSGGKLVDFNAPSGTVTIEHVDAATTSPTVRLDVLGRDDVSGVDQFQVSNDGSSWATYANSSYDSHFQTLQWNLANASYGGSSSPGMKTVYVRFHDRAGHWGAAVADAIDYAPDGPPPAPPAPVVRTYSETIRDDQPVSYWRLDETSGTVAGDETVANPGTFVGATTLGAPGLIPSDPASTAVGFDGASGQVRIGQSGSLNLGSAITLEAWIQPSSLPAAGSVRTILGKTGSYALELDGASPAFSVYVLGARCSLAAPAGTVAAGRRSYVVGTYDGATMRLWVDGAEVASHALSGAADQTLAGARIGSWDGRQRFFAGVIDEAALYANPLSAAQIAAHAAAGPVAPRDASGAPGGGAAGSAGGRPHAAPHRSLRARLHPTRVRLRHGRTDARLILTASAAGRARLTLVRLRSGSRRGHRHRCIAGPGRGRRCTLAQAVGSSMLALHAGRHTLPLPVRYGRARLAPGRWRLVIALERAAPVRLTFTVRR